jgi:hypothetical protein
MRSAPLAIEFTRDDRPDLVLFEKGTKRIVVSFVSQNFPDAGDQADAGVRHHTVGSVTRREDQHPGTCTSRQRPRESCYYGHL